MDEICAHLEAVSWSQRPELAPDGWDREKSIRQLVINVPPGTSKSLLVCVFWPAWFWTLDGSIKWIFASYDARLTRRDHMRSMRVIESDWYRERWGDIKGEIWAQTYAVNRIGGSRLATSVGGAVTGNHADVQVVDDPHKPLDVLGHRAIAGVKLDEAHEWWDSTMPTRVVDAEQSARLIIMQRLVEDDIAGRAIRSGRYDVLRLPMRFEASEPSRTRLGGDWRTREGELLAPLRYSEAAIARLEVGLGSEVAIAAQLQQRPMRLGGSTFRVEWLERRWDVLPTQLVGWLQSWDMRFLENSIKGDWVVGSVWALLGADAYLVDLVRGRWSLGETIAEVKKLSAKWPKAALKLVEARANGPAVVASLRKTIPGFDLVEPLGGKEARANAVQPYFVAGNVVIPSERVAPWVRDYVDELAVFPRGRHDDQVDSTTQALLRLYARNAESYLAAMKVLGQEFGR